MSYLRPFILTPKELRLTALDAWLQHVFHLIRDNQILSLNRKPAITPSSSTQSFDNILQSILLSSTPADSNFNEILGYLDLFMPISMQEEAFHRGTQMVRKEELFCGQFDMYASFFYLFWRQEFRLLNIPQLCASQDRISVLEHLIRTSENSSTNDKMLCKNGLQLENVKFRMFEKDLLNIEESYLMKRVLRSLTNLRSLVLWKVADDNMLSIIGQSCEHLETIDVWRSQKVTDMGLKFLLSFSAYEEPWNDEDMTMEVEDAEDNPQVPHTRFPPSKLCQSLLRVVVKETSCTHIGIVFLIVHCDNLEVLDFSHGVVVREFLDVIRDLYLRNKKTFSLKTLFLPVTSSEILHDVVHAFPNLEDLRLWTSISHIRDKMKTTDFPHLHSLMLGGLQSNRILTDLVEIWGHQLTTLKLETVLTVIPLQTIGNCCSNLIELQIINARLSIDRSHDCSNETYFENLKLVYFFLVTYITNTAEHPPDNIPSAENYTPSALHCILRHAKKLEGIQATGTSSFTDESLFDIIKVNSLRNLRRFILTDAAVPQYQHVANGAGIIDGTENTARHQRLAQNNTNRNPQENGDANLTSPKLTANSVIRLFETCPHLQCTGDLRHWQITVQERRQIFKLIQNRQVSQSTLMNSSVNSNNAENKEGTIFPMQTLG